MNYDIYDEIGNLLDRERYDEAIELIGTAYEDSPDIHLIILLAHVYGCKKENLKAIGILKSIENEIDEDQISYYYELGSCYFFSGRLQLARRQLEKCISIDPSFAEAYPTLCCIALETNNHALLRKYMQLAVENDITIPSDDIVPSAVSAVGYSDRDENDIIRFLCGKFGSDFMTLDFDGFPIRFILFPPTDQMYYYKLITLGLGASEIHLSGFGNEIITFLPPVWNIRSRHVNYFWPFLAIRQLIELSAADRISLDIGHSLSNGEPYADNTGFNGIILGNIHNPLDPFDEFILDSLHPKAVRFLQMIPLYEEEQVYKLRYGHQALFDRLTFFLGSRSRFCMIDNQRENMCAELHEKDYVIPESCIEDIFEWYGADGCFATDKIMVDGERIGYMYREAPLNEFDSGWRFLAGSEDKSYMDDEQKQGIYKLNTLCNYDLIIADYLDSPCGTAFYRNKHGQFIKDEHFTA